MTITIHQRLHAEHIQLRIHHQLQPTLLDTSGGRQCRQLHQAVGMVLIPCANDG